MAASVSPRTPSTEIVPQPIADAPPLARTPPGFRVDSIDLLRGIVMVVMMLDHTRDFIHNAVLQFDPTDPTRTNVVLFFTRWVTHFCAPVFVFLAGTGAYLQLARGKSKSDLSRFLITRGLWLILLELTVVRLEAFFNFDLKLLALLQVIWVIGVSMIVLAALIYLPLGVIASIGLAMIAFHNILDLIPAAHVQVWRGPGTPIPGLGAKLWMVLHRPGLFPIGSSFPSPIVFVLYPLIPWIGVMVAGYAFGSFYQKDAAQRRRALIWIGGVAVALFIVLRAINIYGDPSAWSHQKNAVYTFLSLLNTTKYPPSLLFLLMTLGSAILALAWFDSVKISTRANTLGEKLKTVFITFGRVPLFFYLLQWPTAHTISILLHLAFGKPVRWLFQTPMDWQNAPPGIGFNLVVVYIAWIAGVLLLYPLCKWFAGLKQRRRDWWLSYL